MSHLTLIPAHTLRVRNWNDYGELHRTVMGLFSSTDLPGEPNQKRVSRNILFRIDETGNGKIVLIRSDIAPTNLPRDTRTKEVADDVPAALTAIRFRLTVNAIRRARPANPSINRGTGMTPIADITDWMATRLADALEDVTVFTHDRTVATSGKAPLQVDVIDGYAIVRDPDALKIALREGVGRSKAYGCGLLTIARA